MTYCVVRGLVLSNARKNCTAYCKSVSVWSYNWCFLWCRW